MYISGFVNMICGTKLCKMPKNKRTTSRGGNITLIFRNLRTAVIGRHTRHSNAANAI